MRSTDYDGAHTPTCTDYSTVFPRIDAQAFISFVTPWTRRLNEAGIHVLPAHAHPHPHSSRRGRNSLQFGQPYGKPRERQAHSIAFNLKDTSKHLFCAIGVLVGEVQLAPSSLLRGASGQLATPPSWYQVDPASNQGLAFICYATSGV